MAEFGVLVLPRPEAPQEVKLLEEMGGLREHDGPARGMSQMWIDMVQKKRPHSHWQTKPQVQGVVIDELEDERTFDREIRINPGCPGPVPRICIPPRHNCLLVEPHRETATVDQGTVVRTPVTDAIAENIVCLGHAPTVAVGVTVVNYATKSSPSLNQWSADLCGDEFSNAAPLDPVFAKTSDS